MGKHNPPTRGERRAANARRLREQHRKNKVRKARRKLKNMRKAKKIIMYFIEKLRNFNIALFIITILTIFRHTLI